MIFHVHKDVSIEAIGSPSRRTTGEGGARLRGRFALRPGPSRWTSYRLIDPVLKTL